ncbi:MAG TPA: 16S rRNA (cytosine(1402)-N(4))-methyltransferase RsmH [Patescibacteria group bacterium]|nr:16S rRNA (cytosine(1402)-N(4))-methyltransferase RsmH [Patescibacteria group bacterium]
MTKHIPVLLQEVIEILNPKNGDTVVDATLGGGGHTRAILKRVSGGRVIALDADESALMRFREYADEDAFIKQALTDQSLLLVHENYSSLGRVLEQAGVDRCDAIVADLGFSSDQIESKERGFSFLYNGPLDMRLDRTTTLTAETIVNTFPLSEIEKILREYGDETECHTIARAIGVARKKQPIVTTDALRNIIKDAYPKGKRYRMKIHPATKTFQALRIAVNQEFEHLRQFLIQAIERLKTGGHLAIITFHSGEDRLVKQCFKESVTGCVCPPSFPLCRCGRTPIIKILTKKPILPSEAEVQKNPRSRSAKLRSIEKL